jgi:hypothetical protein
MGFIERELERIAAALRDPERKAEHRELYAAQQALSWAIEPEGFRCPYETITGTLEGLKGCSAPTGLVLS